MLFEAEAVFSKRILKVFVAPLAHGLRMTANLVVMKMIAVVLGPLGMGNLGNFMSLTTMVSVFAGGGISTGITKYVAEYNTSPYKLVMFLGSAFSYGFLFSIVFLLSFIVFSEHLSVLLFGHTDYSWLMPIIGVLQSICFFGTAVIAIANGQKRQDVFGAITLIGYLISIPISFFLIKFFGVGGAAIALLFVASATGVPAVYFVLRSPLTRLVHLQFNMVDVKRLFRFSLMVLASALLFPLSEMFIRSSLIRLLGYEDAGLWQATTRFSGAYLGFFTLYLSTSYMPYLSALNDRAQIIRTVVKTIIRFGILFFSFSIALYSIKEHVIIFLFSADFMPMKSLLVWQLIGDIFRLSAYVIGFLGVAKAAFRLYLFCEFFQVLLLTSMALFVLNGGGHLLEVIQSYAVAYFIYFIIMLIAFFQYCRGRFDFSC